MTFLTIILAVILVAIVYIYRHFNRRHGDLEKLGIPIVPPFLCFGSPPFDLMNYTAKDLYTSYFEKFGKTYGKYDGIKPTIVSIDPEIAKLILVKHFDAFTDFFEFNVPEKFTTLDASSGEVWRELRKMLSPTFTTGKLKAMVEPIDILSDKLINEMEKARSKNEFVNISHLFQCFGMSVIANCAFGIEVDPYNDENDELLKHGRSAIATIVMDSWANCIFMKLASMLPELTASLPGMIPPAYNNLFDISQNIINQRRKENIKKNDFVGRLIELQDAIKDKNDTLVTADMLTSQGIIFFVAGYETTANTMTSMMHSMAKFQDVQENIYEEIQSVIEEHNGVIDNDTINEMKYLEAAINENLRLNGPVVTHMRKCGRDIEIKPGFMIKKDMQIELPLYTSHHWPEFFPEPEVFKPERFLKENAGDLIPYTFRPFGAGNRECIGKRFSMIEMKLALAKIFNKYKVVASSRENLEPKKGEVFMLLFPDTGIKLEPRK